GQYIWYVIADLKNNTAVQGTIGNFIISSLQVEATSDYLSPPHCAPGTSCTPIGDTPTLKWNSVPSAGSYLVYIAIDPGFTNTVRIYATNYTELTPRESLLDNQAGQAYYWFVRPCKTPTTCGPFDSSVFGHARAFQKRSVKTTPTGPTDGSSNALTYSDVFRVTKSSPKISLQYPHADVVLTNQGVPYFQWTPQLYAATYEIEVYKDGDLHYSPVNRVLDAQTKMTAWAP